MFEKVDLGELLVTRTNKKIYRNKNLLIKVFDHEKVGKSTVLFEALNQSYVEKVGLNIPKMISIFPYGEDWAIASEFIEGETLQEKMEKDPSNYKKYLELLVKLQLEVLSKRTMELPKLKDKLNAKISFLGKEESLIKLEATTRYDLHMRLESMPDHNKLCHGDFNPSNIVCTKDNKYYILDWAHACRGNASADASSTYLNFVLNHNQKYADEYLKLFCKKADIAIQYVQRWICVVSATLLNSVQTEEQRELLLRNINVVESM